MDDIFAPHNVQEINRKKQRPLGAFSDFAVEGLPYMLSAQTAGDVLAAARTAERFASSVTIEQLDELEGSSLDLAILDLLHVHTGILHAARMYDEKQKDTKKTYAIAAANLMGHMGRLINHVAKKTGRHNEETYGDLVLVNPLLDDPRLFTLGTVGGSERSFLYGHTVIERKLGKVIELLEEAIRDSKKQNTNVYKAAQLFADVNAIVSDFQTKLNTGDFHRFRQYFSSHPISNKPGASGRYSAKVQMARILVDGDLIDRLDPEYFSEILPMAHHYPKVEFVKLQGMLSPTFINNTTLARLGQLRPHRQGIITLGQLVHAFGNKPEDVTALKALREQMDIFVGRHLGATRHHIPGIKGTGGESDTEAYLNRKRRLHERAAQFRGQVIAERPSTNHSVAIPARPAA